MARIYVHPGAVEEFTRTNPAIRNLLMETAYDVAAEAQATADYAQLGPEGRLTGYAEAGFSVIYEPRGTVPRVLVQSNADGDTATRVHFYTQKRDGVGHLRAALYKFTLRG